MRSLPLRRHHRVAVYLPLVVLPLTALAQTTIPEGVVTDAKTKEKLPFVSVAVPQAALGTNTDENGHFLLRIPAQDTTVVFSYVGYRTVTRTLVAGVPQEIDVQLTTSNAVLNEVVVRGTKLPRYKNKDNPAVALIRQIIEHKAQNRPESYDYVEYDKYEKMAFSFSNLSDKFKNKKIFRNYQFLFKTQDSTAAGGVNILPIYLEEKLARKYYRKNPEKQKTVPLGTRQVQFDKQFIDNEGLSTYFNRMYQDVALYATKRFYLSQPGISDVVLEGGYTFGQVPFPLLTVHRANQTYSYQLNLYNLMNFQEFSSDHYASLFIDHNFNGLFFNRLPLLKKLKLREVASIKLLYGGIREENNPEPHPALYQFLEDAQGQPTTFALGRRPYAEASVSLANIFKLLRVDVVRRLTYLANPNVAEWGLRGRFKVNF